MSKLRNCVVLILVLLGINALAAVGDPYTVKFNANGGSGTMANESFVYGTAKALTINTFTRTGYTFVGWAKSSTATTSTYDDGQTVNNLTTTSGGTVNLYAVWQANTYTLTLNANGGECTHPCRWKYALMEETRPGEYMPVYENERGTYIFNSKDLCMIEHIPELIEAGIDSFKI